MLELRKKLSRYQEILYLLFLLPMTGMVSMGLNSEDRIYLYVFAAATLFLVLKMAVTDYNLREFVVVAVLTLVFGAIFLRNGEKTLLLTLMAIFGAKNVNLDKALKYALWEKAIFTVGTLTLAATGVIENEYVWLPKNLDHVMLQCYGYYQPNSAFANIFVVLLLVILVYREKLKWYSYLIGSVIMFGAYKVFMCRTGLLVWVLLCLMVLCYVLAKHFHVEKVYGYLLCAIPAVLTLLALVLPLIAQKNETFNKWINIVLTGRINYVNEVYGRLWNLVPGQAGRASFDSIYVTALYNYGWILFLFVLAAYIAGMWYCNKKGQYYAVIGLGIMAVYGYMELFPLSVMWNLPLLYLSQVLFREKTVRNEQLQ